MARNVSAIVRPAAAGILGLWASAVVAAGDPARGAQLYMRLADDTRSCVSCHGPDPGQNHNNILRAADNAATLSKVLGTVSQMGFLASSLSDTDREDITAFLGTVTRLNGATSPLQVFPLTTEFGSFMAGAVSPVQRVRIVNRAATATPLSVEVPATESLDVRSECPPALSPGASCEVQLRLMPTAIALARPVVRIATTELPGGVVLGMSGRAVGSATSQLVWDGSPVVVRFGQSGNALQQQLRLVNPGPASATLALTSIVGPSAASFRIEGGCASGQVLAPGSACELKLSHTPNALPLSQAALQVRSDQANPPALMLEAAAQAAPTPDSVPTGGGGCSVGPPGGKSDPLLLLSALAALCALLFSGRSWSAPDR